METNTRLLLQKDLQGQDYKAEISGSCHERLRLRSIRVTRMHSNPRHSRPPSPYAVFANISGSISTRVTWKPAD